jgi:Xylanase inhibitor N-terminal
MGKRHEDASEVGCSSSAFFSQPRSEVQGQTRWERRRRNTGRLTSPPVRMLVYVAAFASWTHPVFCVLAEPLEPEIQYELQSVMPFSEFLSRRRRKRVTIPDPDDISDSGSGWTFHLHPTAALTVEEERQKLRGIDGGDPSTSNHTPAPHHYEHWFAPEQNAVYATIPDPADSAHADNRQLHEFHAHRHLSRYERRYRTDSGLDLLLDWDGIYNDAFFALLEDEDILFTVDNATVSYANATSRIRQSNRRAVEYTTKDAASSSTVVSAGGQFNNYQAVPLSQGYGTHFANVWVGTPTPQRKTVIVDTGSHYTAFPCTGCKNCGAPHHTDPYFGPEKSLTFHQLQCSECQDGVICDGGMCKFNQAYTEGSTWDAVQVKDQFYCGGTDVLDSVDPIDRKYAIEFMFGCQVSMTGLFITQLADGIMGMSAHPATLPKKLYDERKIEHNMFAMCFRRELGTSKRGVTAGSMTLGGVSNSLDTSPLVFAKNVAKIGWFTVFVKNIYVRSGGGQSAKSIDPIHQTIKVRVDVKTLNSGKGVIVDSGTTDTYLNKKVAKEFTRAWKEATGQVYSHAPMSLTPEQLRSLPTILIQCQAYSVDTDPSIEDYDSIPGYAGSLDPTAPKDLLIAIPATSYMDFSPITKRYMSRLYFTESVGGVLGSNTMQGHNVLFDWQNGRVGFAESSCAYDKKDVPDVAEDSGFATDCKVGDPILTKACIETVDRRMCKLNPTSIALLGRETWTAVIENPGNDAGISCFEASMGVDGKQNDFDDSVVTCDGQGLCEEERPCQLTCAQAAKAAEAKPLLSTPDGRLPNCGDSGWSACDYGCMQTKVESMVYTNGICHEVSRTMRPCHIGACARSDPCRVPFIVHTVLAFRGGSVSKWSQEAEEILATALANAVGRHSEDQLFAAGDVHVAAALPWYQDQDEYDKGDFDGSAKDYGEDYNAVKLGMKVVVEISMFNPLADAENKTTLSEDIVDESDGTLSTMLRNITDRLRGRNPRVTCVQEELYPLATLALKAKDVLRHDHFMSSLIDELTRAGEQADWSSFGPIGSSSYDASESRISSVWTIRTGIEDEINYFGPQKPLATTALAFLQNMVILSLAFFAVMVLWSCVLTIYDYCNGQSHRQIIRSRQPYCLVSRTEDPNDIENTIIMGNGAVELTSHSPTYKLTMPKKRIRRVSSIDSTDH